MKVIRLIANLILAVVVGVLCIALVLLAFGQAMAGPWQNAAASAEEGAWAWVDEQPIHYRTWGPEDGAPLVLVPGLEVGGSALWAPLGASLGRAGYRAIAVDLPPLGRSSRAMGQDLTVQGQAETLLSVLAQLDAQDVTLVAQSWGGMVAVQAALDQPERVRSLVLVGPQRDTVWHPYERLIAQAPGIGDSFAWLARGGGPVWEALLRFQVFRPSDEYRAYAKESKAASQIEGTVSALQALYALDPASVTPMLKPLRTPCLIVRGAQDRFVSAEQVIALADELDADVRTVEDAGHLIALDQPEALRKAILETLQP